MSTNQKVTEKLFFILIKEMESFYSTQLAGLV